MLISLCDPHTCRSTRTCSTGRDYPDSLISRPQYSRSNSGRALAAAAARQPQQRWRAPEATAERGSTTRGGGESWQRAEGAHYVRRPVSVARTPIQMSWTDSIFSSLLGSVWEYVSGGDLLPDAPEGPDTADVEAGAAASGRMGDDTPVQPRYADFKALKGARQQQQHQPGPPAMAAASPPPATPQQASSQAPLYAAEGQHNMVGYYVKTVGDAPVTVPTPLTPEQVAKVSVQAEVGSAWNAGGATWETRDLSSWIKTRLPQLCAAELLADSPGASYDTAAAAAQNSTPPPPLFLSIKVGGESEASVAVVRGAVRPGFDLSLELEWAGGNRATLEVLESDLPPAPPFAAPKYGVNLKPGEHAPPIVQNSAELPPSAGGTAAATPGGRRREDISEEAAKRAFAGVPPRVGVRLGRVLRAVH
eukprot:COSAG05_NODE_150_length_16171_cov_64.740356_15_plen_419_part_01